MYKSVLTGMTLLLSLQTLAQVDISKVQAEIKKQNANWKASSNRIAKMSDVEIKRLLGSNEMPNGQELFFERTLSNEVLDWRNVDGKNWLGPIMNQGNCGSCVAFASIASLEARYRISMNAIWANPTFSPQYLFDCGGGFCDFGWTPSSAAKFLKKNGVVDNACRPYVSGSTGEDMSCKQVTCKDEEKRIYKIADYDTPSGWSKSAASVKKALKNGPLVTTLTVYSDFLTYSGGIYKHVTGKREGGHAVSLVGFNDMERYWIVRNSWGADWGENGFVRVSYDDDSGIASSTWAFDVSSDKNYFAITSPSDHSYISGKLNVAVKMQNPKASKLTIIGNGETSVLNECVLTNDICTYTLDSTQLRDGRYEIMAESNGQRSLVKEIFIVNKSPETKVFFNRADGKPISTPISGRIEFNIDIDAMPVIPQSVSLKIIDAAGKVIATRTTDTVVSKMRLGFRFNTLSDGNYKMYYEAITPYNGQLIKTVSNIENIFVKN